VTLALPDHWLPWGFWYSASTEGRGTHTRVTPAGFSTSARVVTSNVRHRPGRGLNALGWAHAAGNRPDRRDAAAVTGRAAVARRKVRRFIGLPFLCVLGGGQRTGRLRPI
jgi:hypothetical protein